MQKIVIVEDDEKLRNELKIFLEKNGYQTVILEKFNNAVKDILKENADLILLDINLPFTDGEFICKEIRKESQVPIIMVTSRDNEIDELLSMNYGADHYVTKPFNIQIAMQRIQAVLRRTMGKKEEHLYRCGNLVIDFETRTVTKSGEKLSLTPTEFKLLYVFVKNENMALTRNLLLEKLWDSEGNFVDEHTLTINISRLRAKIKDAQYKYIKTLYGMGYQWVGAQNE